MAFLSTKELEKLTGVPSNSLATFRKRGKIVKSGEFYDDTLELNRNFIEKWRLKNKLDDRIDEVKDEKPVVNILPPGIPKPTAPNIAAPDGKKITQADLERSKLILDNEKKEKEIEKLKIQIAKLNGEVIPTELVKLVLIQNNKAQLVNFKQGADNLLIEFIAMKGLSSKEQAILKGKIIAIANTSNENAIKDSMKQIKNIINEYSSTRGRGEKK